MNNPIKSLTRREWCLWLCLARRRAHRAMDHGVDGKFGLHPRGGQLRHLPAQRPLRLHKLEKARGLADGLTCFTA